MPVFDLTLPVAEDMSWSARSNGNKGLNNLNDPSRQFMLNLKEKIGE
jgi:hypothetical protein